jgi:predicted transcriptional regulator
MEDTVMSKLVRDLMHRGLITCHTDATIGQLAAMMSNQYVHALVVCDRDQRPLGIISDFDLLAGEWLSADAESLEAMRNITAAELMSTPIDTIEADASIVDAARCLVEDRIHRLMVMEDGKPVGIISISDFIAHLAERGPVSREKVADVMSDALLVCRRRTPLSQAAAAMTSTGWRSITVVDATGAARGMVSGFDLLPYVDKEGSDQITVGEVMHPPLTITMDASLREAVDMMIANHYHRLIVVDPDAPDTFPLGQISSFDIVAEMAKPGSIWQQ